MSKKVLAVMISIVVALAGVVLLKNYQENSPHLVGKCYLMSDGTGLAIPESTELEDENGEKVQVYVGVLLMGPFQVPQPLKIKETNQIVAEMVEKKQAQEVDCETGQPK